MLPLTISYNYEIVYHRQKERESLKSPLPCCFDRFFSFLHFLMAYFSTKSEVVNSENIGEHCSPFLFPKSQSVFYSTKGIQCSSRCALKHIFSCSSLFFSMARSGSEFSVKKSTAVVSLFSLNSPPVIEHSKNILQTP